MAAASAAGLPKMEIAELRAMSKLYTKCLRRSNALFVSPKDKSIHNLAMKTTDKVDAILRAREWGWADLARAMDLSEQRVNHWRTRGIPAAQVRNVESALGLKRYALDEDAVAEDEAAAMIAEFAVIYREITDDGRGFLRDVIGFARRTYAKNKKPAKTGLSIVGNKRGKA